MNTKQPLAGVFGHLITDMSERACRYRTHRLCPFNNKVPNCTKDKAKNPLGVCSIFHGQTPVITCPIRFREDWIITDDAASFFFDPHANWSSLTEVRLNDALGKSAGNIDVVLAAYDDQGKVFDFGSLEVQAVYISGNVRDPFEEYMRDTSKNATFDWHNQPNYPRPDYLSSSRKRLVPQLLYKGGIMKSWNKKTAVALNKSFFDTLPTLKTVKKKNADMAWLIYDFELIEGDKKQLGGLTLKKVDEIFTQFEPALLTMTTPNPGKMSDFMVYLQGKLDEQTLVPPNNKLLDNPLP